MTAIPLERLAEPSLPTPPKAAKADETGRFAPPRHEGALASPFARVPARAAADSNLSRLALRALIALATFADRRGLCFPAQATLAAILGRDRSRIAHAIVELRAGGYVEVRRGRYGCVYRLVYLPVDNVDPDVRTGAHLGNPDVRMGAHLNPVPESRCADGCTSDVRTGAHRTSPKNKQGARPCARGEGDLSTGGAGVAPTLAVGDASSLHLAGVKDALQRWQAGAEEKAHIALANLTATLKPSARAAFQRWSESHAEEFAGLVTAMVEVLRSQEAEARRQLELRLLTRIRTAAGARA